MRPRASPARTQPAVGPVDVVVDASADARWRPCRPRRRRRRRRGRSRLRRRGAERSVPRQRRGVRRGHRTGRAPRGSAARWPGTSPRPRQWSIAVIDAGVDGSHPDLSGRVTPVPPGSGGCLGITTPASDGRRDLDRPRDDGRRRHRCRPGNGVGVAGVVRAPVHVRSYKVLQQSGATHRRQHRRCRRRHRLRGRRRRRGRQPVARPRRICPCCATRSTGLSPLASSWWPRRATAATRRAARSRPPRTPASSASPPPMPATIGPRSPTAVRGSTSPPPGTDVLSTARNGDFGVLSRTSFSTPFVSGVAAQMLARRACLPLDALTTRPAVHGRRTSATRALGSGRLDYATGGAVHRAGRAAMPGGGGTRLAARRLRRHPLPRRGPCGPLRRLLAGLGHPATSRPARAGPAATSWTAGAPCTPSPRTAAPARSVLAELPDRPGGRRARPDGARRVHPRRRTAPCTSSPRPAAAPFKGAGGSVLVRVGHRPRPGRRPDRLVPGGFVLDGFGGVHTFGFGAGVQVNTPGITPGGTSPARSSCSSTARRLRHRRRWAGPPVVPERPADAAGRVAVDPALRRRRPGDRSRRRRQADGRFAVRHGDAHWRHPVPPVTWWPGFDIVRAYAAAP